MDEVHRLEGDRGVAERPVATIRRVEQKLPQQQFDQMSVQPGRHLGRAHAQLRRHELIGEAAAELQIQHVMVSRAEPAPEVMLAEEVPQRLVSVEHRRPSASSRSCLDEACRLQGGLELLQAVLGHGEDEQVLGTRKRDVADAAVLGAGAVE